MAGVGKHLWAPHQAQRKQETMYHLRRLIRDRGITVDSGLRSIELGFKGNAKPLVDEALQSKCPGDGQNLLMFAAAQGNEAWFIGLVGEIRSRLGIGALVKMLREIDIDGAPLLFHAASSRREHSCFRTAYDLITMVLGKGGRTEQVDAGDGLGRGILMHAARSNHVETFREVLRMCREDSGGRNEEEHSEPTLSVPAATDARLVLEADILGMNCLHHAAEAGCFEVLKEVFDIFQEAGKETYKADNARRTPLMLVLRNESRCDQDELKLKFDILYKGWEDSPHDSGANTRKKGWMTPSSVPPQCPPVSGKTKAIETQAVTELMHAARGGLASLELALSYHPLNIKRDGGDFTVDLDEALAVEVELENGVWGKSTSTDNAVWGRALLLAAAAKLGDVDVISQILNAIEKGKFSLKRGEDAKIVSLPEVASLANDEPMALPINEEVKNTIEAISDRYLSVFSYAIMSGRTDAVKLINDLVLRTFRGDTEELLEKTWRILSGHPNENSSLTCAASAPMEADNNGLTMFDFVFSLLKKQMERRSLETRCRLLQDLYSPINSLTKSAGGAQEGRVKIPPLVAAAFSGNWILFREIYDSYEKWTKQRWTRKNVMAQIPSGPPRRHSVVELVELHECQDKIPLLITRGAWNIPAVMWRDIVKAYIRGKPEAAGQSQDAPGRGPDAAGGGRDAAKYLQQSWRSKFRGYSHRAVEVAAERGTFTALRDLVQEGFPLNKNHIPAILENIGDHEQDVIEIILATVANASNPFVMGAGVSRTLRTSEVDHPMHQKSLRRLHGSIDEFTTELLDKLPHTVRGMGVVLLGGHQPIVFDEGLQQWERHRLGNLAGFIVVQWMLEPRRLLGEMKGGYKYTAPVFTDPLRRALDRGSKGQDLINSPLVLDYVEVKFMGTLPSWTSRNPFQPTINEGFYKYEGFDKYPPEEMSSRIPPKEEGKSPALTEKFFSKSFLLRLLQGWDHTDSDLKWNIPVKWNSLVKEDSPPAGGFGAEPKSTMLQRRTVPHSTVLPGLQFSLAGILGKPETFYQVPVIRFIFEIFGYAVMLGLFCSSVLLKEHDFVPFDEVIFYIFTAGMVCREILEFRDNVPARRHKPHPRRTKKNGKKIPLISCRGIGQRFNRMVSAFTRYVFYDTWNFLDTLTICCILVAFIFRMMALNSEDLLFHAQFFYALSAPLLFSRLLVLSQIDATLGPMTQVIWRMMSHMLRFSAFIAMVMLSFALAFHAVFHTCGTDNSSNRSCPEETEESPLGDAFGTFGHSFVTVFSSALGGPNFDIFEVADSECSCDLPPGAKGAGIFLMVAYMVTMSVVLLNLLIAVLSTAHDEVYANAEKEFHLARARLVYQSAHVVSRGRPPPPLNLLKVVLGLLVDAGTELWRLCLLLPAFCAAENAEECRDRAKKLPPASTRHEWKTFEGGLQRWAFAWTLGAAAVVLSATLWILSVPWVAWSLLRCARQVEQEHSAEDSNYKNDEQHDGQKTWNVDEEDEEKMPPGYFRALGSGTKGFFYLLLAIVGALVLCFFYILGSVLLWIIGMCRIFRWMVDNWKEDKDNIPEAMPGQENGDHWKRAWELARRRNNGVREHGGRPHFHVVPLLKSRTGLDTQHLARLINARDTKSKSKEELIRVDRNLPDARIDLEHLLLKTKSRAEQRWKDSNINTAAAAQPPVASTLGGNGGSGGGSTEDEGGGSGGGGVGETNGVGGSADRDDSEIGGKAPHFLHDPAVSGGSAAAVTHDRDCAGDDAPLPTPAPAFGVRTIDVPYAKNAIG